MGNNDTLGSTRLEEGIMRRVKFKVVTIDSRGRRESAFAGGRYSLEYPKGKVVRAKEGTLGVAVFETWEQAEDFRVSRLCQKTIHVRPVGRGKTVEIICFAAHEEELDVFYSKKYRDRKRDLTMKEIPTGTIFYPAVEVLD